MKRHARVTGVSPETIEAIIERPAACVGCTGGCHKNALDWFSGAQGNRVIIHRKHSQPQHTRSLFDHDGFFSENPQVGDRFVIELDDNVMLRSAGWLYGLPLLFIVLGMGVFYLAFSVWTWPADLGGVVGALMGLLTARQVVARYKPANMVRFS